AESTAFTIAPEAAFAITAETAATIVALAVTIGLAHHRRGTFLVLFDADGEVADDVFRDPLLPLDLGDRGRGRFDVHQHEMCLAILVHAVGEGAHAPVLGLGDLAAEPFDDARHLGRQLFDLLGARILAREKNMLIKRHGCPFLCWRGSRRQALRDLRKGLDNAQKAEARDDGPTGPATSTSPNGEIAETVRSAPGRDPRMARFIRVFSALARLLPAGPRLLEASCRVALAFAHGAGLIG